MKTDKKGNAIKRLNIDLTLEVHNKVKSEAMFRNVSLKKYVTEAILDRIKRDKRYQ